MGGEGIVTLEKFGNITELFGFPGNETVLRKVCLHL